MIAAALLRACLWTAANALRLAAWLVEGGAPAQDIPPKVREYLEEL